MQNEHLRNVAIIAHVDHGKTTLVDEMLKQGGVYRTGQEVVERVMDSGDLERERGITIMAKNTAIRYGDTKINIVDTPGHADFGGEVERILKMVNGVILLVDAAEGPMPQTRFVLSKALELGHRVIVVVNKIDRPDQRIHEVIDEVLELLMDLDATPDQLDSPMLFCSARQGICSYSPDVPGTDLKPLFETILEYIPAPEADVDQPFQMLVSSIDYNDFVGRIAIGRIERGTLRQNQEVAMCNYHAPEAVLRKAKATAIYEFEGLDRTAVSEATAGNIIAMSGLPDVTIGDTICASDCVEALPFVKISRPTLEMTFSVNDSPYAGREGKYVTSRQIRDRLYRETLKDVSLRVTDTDKETAFNVAGRGEMSLSILIETMRREGYEFQVSPPRVLYQEIDGKRCEPIERLVVDVPADSVGAVIEKLGQRKADMLEMTPVGNRMKVEFLIPARGLFGYRNDFLTDTKGEGIMASVFDSYAPYKGDIQRRGMGSLICSETGESITYGLFNAQERGTLFIGAGVPVYEGMIIGIANRGEDITVNACKKKQLTNTRASGSDDALRLVPPKQMSLEQCLEFLADDELLEVTPKSLRMRKAILNHEQRMKALHGKK
ncbi:translational GTPase TypA [Oscillibacter valericigenes]|uniref:translational GTPase TypA n=1 Tax=Oscillibacter valericigenes TaxID=351091 RepID=UPI001F2596E8|nr:translational GTPase TypA [Oscillibacter valericigenes]MCF2617914.1 translational GTPase TypA [Oscillibacter valericigenes]